MFLLSDFLSTLCNALPGDCRDGGVSGFAEQRRAPLCACDIILVYHGRDLYGEPYLRRVCVLCLMVADVTAHQHV